MKDLETSALRHEVKESQTVARLAKASGAEKNLVAHALRHLRSEEKNQLHKVEHEARDGIWSSYQATLQLRQRQLKKQMSKVQSALHREEEFGIHVSNAAFRLAAKTKKLGHLEDSVTGLSTHLHAISSSAEAAV